MTSMLKFKLDPPESGSGFVTVRVPPGDVELKTVMRLGGDLYLLALCDNDLDTDDEGNVDLEIIVTVNSNWMPEDHERTPWIASVPHGADILLHFFGEP